MDTNEWNERFAISHGPLAANHPSDCFVKHDHFEEGLPLSEIQKKYGITNPHQIVYLLNVPCGMYKNHSVNAEYLYQNLPRK